MPKTINTNTTLTQISIASQKAKLIASLQALIEGLNAELVDTTPLVINQKTYTKAELISVFQGQVDSVKKTLAARIAAHLAVSEEQAAAPGVDLLRKGVKSYLESRYGTASASLQRFGYLPRKTRQVAAATTAQAQVLAKATRKARGTVGKKTKALIKAVAAPSPIAGSPPSDLLTLAPLR